MNILLISASTRPGRTSHRVALHLEKRLNASNIDVKILDLMEHKLPMFEEVMGKLATPPPALAQVQQLMQWCDAMVWVTPEYNGTYTSALKNLIDYFNKQEFTKKVIGISTITTGALGGMRAAVQMQNLACAVFGYPCPYMLPVPLVTQKLDENGDLLDPAFEKNVNTFLNEFVWLATAVKAQKEAVVGVG